MKINDLKFWFPTLNSIPSHFSDKSWFDYCVYFNLNCSLPTNTIIKTDSIKTLKLKIYPTIDQKNIIVRWLDDVIDTYNITNQYIKDIIYKDNCLIKDKKIIRETINFFNLRKNLNLQINAIISKNSINKHTLDYAVKLCVEMYKSSFSNHINGQFNIKDLDKNRRRKNLVLEPQSFSKKINGFCIRELGEMKSDKCFKSLVEKNSILQYDSYKKEFYVITPINCKFYKELNKIEKCGIDIGVRTFATVYSPNMCLEFGKDIIRDIDKYLNKKDKLKSDNDNRIISNGKYKRVYNRIESKMRNRIDDMHKKVSNKLFRLFDIINIGKVSINKMISNITGNIREKTKRRLITLKHYKFREYLKLNSKKWNVEIREINEYMTSKTCHNCNNIKKDLKGEDKYVCKKCNIEIGRDINASINILKL